MRVNSIKAWQNQRIWSVHTRHCSTTAADVKPFNPDANLFVQKFQVCSVQLHFSSNVNLQEVPLEYGWIWHRHYDKNVNPFAYESFLI
jgi:hypothetical protein